MTQDNTHQKDQNHESEEVEVAQEVVETQETNIDYKDNWMRAQADYQNLQKEVREQRAQWAKMSEVQMIEAFVPVYENFKKAFAHGTQEGEEMTQKQWENWKKGIEYIKKQFSDILTAHSVTEIVTVGELFDPNKHEALKEEEVEGKKEGEITAELEGGYMHGEMVIKPAKVVVCKPRE